MSTKTTKFNKNCISNLPDDKPVVYKIQTEGGKNNYTGIAKRSRVQERIAEHLPGARDSIPGVRVQIQQMNSIADARKTESRIISRSQPKHNKQGKR